MSRVQLSSDTTLVVTSTGSYPTLQAAWDALALLDCYGFNVTIAVQDGTYSTPLSATIAPLGAASIAVVGNSAIPDNCAVNVSNGDAFWFDGPAKIALSGFKVSATGTGANGVHVSRGAEVGFGNMDFGACTVAQVLADGARAVHGAAYSITAPTSGATIAAEHHHVFNGGVIGADGQAVTLNNAPHFSAYFLGNGGGYASYTGSSFVYSNGPATGKQYFVHGNGFTKLAGTVLPGDAPGNSINGNVDDVVSGLQVGVNGSIWMGSGQTAASAVQIQYNGSDLYITPPSSNSKVYIKGGVLY